MGRRVVTKGRKREKESYSGKHKQVLEACTIDKYYQQ